MHRNAFKTQVDVDDLPVIHREASLRMHADDIMHSNCKIQQVIALYGRMKFMLVFVPRNLQH